MNFSILLYHSYTCFELKNNSIPASWEKGGYRLSNCRHCTCEGSWPVGCIPIASLPSSWQLSVSSTCHAAHSTSPRGPAIFPYICLRRGFWLTFYSVMQTVKNKKEKLSYLFLKLKFIKNNCYQIKCMN